MLLDKRYHLRGVGPESVRVSDYPAPVFLCDVATLMMTQAVDLITGWDRSRLRRRIHFDIPQAPRICTRKVLSLFDG